MNIAIIGAGNVGSALGRAWAESGHNITFGVPHPDKPETVELVRAIEAKATTVKEATKNVDVVALAVHPTALHDVMANISDAENKLIIDCTNTMFAKPDGYDTSTEALVAETKSKRVVKCFNTCGANLIGNAQFGDIKAVTYMAGDDAEAKKVVNALAVDAGFEKAVDCGGVENAGLLEQLASVWVGFVRNAGFGRDFAFYALKR
jgi:predicted dinucleotide-binding enzyme